ncbi:MAG: hypothetical protein ACM3US_15340 [Sphingomonadaceae bacterium]
MLLGRVVKSNSHVDYVVQIFARGEVEAPPGPEDYAFGSFVRVADEGSSYQLIGVIYDTLLLNPTYGTLGPRLSTEPALSTFSPDYLPETSTVVGVAAIGWKHGEGSNTRYYQGVPPIACRIGAGAYPLEEEQFRAFHQSEVGPRVAYLPRLAAMRNPAMPELLNGLLTRLIEAFPDSSGTLAVLRSNLDWNARLARRE